MNPFGFPTQTKKYTDLGYSGVAVRAGGEVPKGKTLIGTEYIPATPYQRNRPARPAQTLYIYGDTPQQAAPTAAPAPAAPSPAVQQLAQLTSQSQAYRKESEAALEAGRLRIQQLENEELQRQKPAELQNRLAIQAQTSQARGAAQASLKIAPASQTAPTAGTQAFKRRRDQTRLAPIQSTAGINAPASSVLNV